MNNKTKLTNSTVLSALFLAIINTILPSTKLVELQILSEIISMILYFYIILNISLSKLEVFALSSLVITNLLSLSYLPINVVLLNTKNLSIAVTSFICIQKINYNKLFLKRVINYLFIINIILIIFKIKFTFLSNNVELINSGNGGIFFNFHVNGFMFGIWSLVYLKTLSFKFFPLSYISYFIGSKSLFTIFVISYLSKFRQFIFFRVKQFKPAFMKCFWLFLVATIIITSLVYIESIKQFSYYWGLSIRDKSLYTLITHISSIDLFKESFSILPGNVYDFGNYKVDLPLIKKSISNEIALFSYLKSYGLINIIALTLLFKKYTYEIRIFLILSLLHYSYILSPLTYWILESYNSNDDDS
tara:strand:+ start:469 stop:1548 length:1080 start_codon:yes stop_codon:yes gene_type:complete